MDGAAATGYRTLTHLWVGGWDAPAWTEYHCVTGDGRYMAVSFAPSLFVNDPVLQARGAFGAIVNLQSGDRWILPKRVALQYHTPGCGVDDTVVWSAYSDTFETDLIRVDAARQRVVDTRHASQQLTSAVPVDGRIVAVRGNQLVEVSKRGSLSRITSHGVTAFDLRPTAHGVDYLALDGRGRSIALEFSLNRKRSVVIASGPQRAVALFSGVHGHNHVVGDVHIAARGQADAVRTARLPSAISLLGKVAVVGVSIPGVTTVGDGGADVTIDAVSLSDGRHLRIGPAPSLGSRAVGTPSAGKTSSKSVASAAAPLIAAPTGSPCSVPPLDPGTQVIQPSPQQVEWAANRAVRGQLTDMRPANWEKHGLPAYSAQSLFPAPSLVGGGHVPVQVVEGLLAQESNFNQASFHAIPGVPGDPLIANYYGTTYASNGLIISMDWSKADCGYGLGQITTHMRAGDSQWSLTLQREVATDYEVNVAAAVWFLSKIWNQLNSSPENIVANTGDPSKIENWYMALWAYNSGIQPTASFGNTSGCTPGPSCTYNGNWGLGWTNNPAQNAYPPNRDPFLRDGYGDAAHPGNWPYQEKVMGWAENPQQDLIKGGLKYTGSSQLELPEDYYTFCQPGVNNCNRTSPSTGYCLSTDRTYCWWHAAVSWFATDLGQHGTDENTMAYQAGAQEPSVADPYPASCSTLASAVVQTPGMTVLPPHSVVVDELPDSSSNLAGCATATSVGSFSLVYGTDSSGNPTGAIDTHQLGVGYMGHSIFTHTISSSRPYVQVTGTWTPPAAVVGWQRIWVHIPDNGADTFQADYQINTGTASFHRVVDQRWNKNVWFDLGSFLLGPGAKVSLSNATLGDFSGCGENGDPVTSPCPPIDISWDAIAFTPSIKPTASYVAFGDSYQAGEGLQPYYESSDNGAKTPPHIDACHRSPQAYPNLVFNDLQGLHPGEAEFHFVACSGATTKSVSASGTDQHWGEVQQLAQGWLDANTTHVTIGIGGNDARFSGILKACEESAATGTNCVWPDYVYNSDTKPLIQEEPERIDNLLSPLTRLYTDIKNAAPNAQILVLGYPYVIAIQEQTRRTAAGCLLWDSSIQWFAQMADRLDGVIASAASAAGVTFVPTVSLFEGPPEHEACAASQSLEWINALMTPSTSGSGTSSVGSGSFHPNALGHHAFDTAIKLKLK